MVLGKPPAIRADDLPVRGPRRNGPAATETLADVEKRHIVNVLERTDWNVTRAAEILEVDRVTVYNKIKKYGLQR
jgi:transcriptional regulator of acetoin/glycerol metabolism